MQPQSYRVAMWIGAAVWIAVTILALGTIVSAPSEHLDLAIGLGVLWVVLLAFAALSRFTERL